ncbi:MAG TPA: histidine phosphatase family protein [Myxococcota bacterium]|nr:histidine phosphatase family protein [Myxococcota bacterium]
MPESQSQLRRVLAAAAPLVAALFGAQLGFAQQQALRPQLDGPQLVDALRAGGLVILMRHASTESFVPQPGVTAANACPSQRNLSEHGRREARDIGAAFDDLGIPVGRVLTSPYCRCVDTGELAFGGGEVSQELGAIDELPSSEKDERARQIRALLNTVPPAGRNTILITHTGTLLYSFGLQSRPEGIAHVFRPAEIGNAIYLGFVTPEQWIALARSSAAGS